jgi:hypothetical protein
MMGTEWEGHNSYVNFTYRQSRAGDKPQVVELMPGTHKTPCSNPLVSKTKIENLHCFMCFLFIYIEFLKTFSTVLFFVIDMY